MTHATGTTTRRMLVSDVMTSTVISVPPEMPFIEVAHTLFAAAVRAVPVVDADGLLLGVVSEADLLATVERTDPADERSRWRHRPRHINRTVPTARAGARTAADLMTVPAVTVGPEVTVGRVARTMRELGLTWLPVVDPDDRVVGVLGRSDLLALFLRSDADIRSQVVDDVLGRTLAVEAGQVSAAVQGGVVILTGVRPLRSSNVTPLSWPGVARS